MPLPITTPTLAGTAIGDGLRILASVFDSDPSITSREFPSQAVEVRVSLATETDVRTLAARFGTPVDVHHGSVWAHIPLGDGVDVDELDARPAFRGAVVLVLAADQAEAVQA